MSGKCPKCDIAVTVLIEAIRARDEVTGKTCPCLQFLCSRCRTVLGVSLDPDWQAEIVAKQLHSVVSGSDVSVQPAASSHPDGCELAAGCTRLNKLLVRLIRGKSCRR